MANNSDFDSSCCAKPGASGLEIKAVRNGWVVFVGTMRHEMMQGSERTEYVFQNADELGVAVIALLRTGKYEGPPSRVECPEHKAFPLASISSKDVDQSQTRECDKFPVSHDTPRCPAP